MKVFIPFCLFLLCFATSANAQTPFGPASSMGFGQIGVVASGNNYQSAYFENPALLARKKHEFDAFANYNNNANLTSVSSVIAGGMLSFGENNAFGLGLSNLRLGGNGNTIFAITAIPLLYARNLYQTDWAGVSVGANFNLTNHRLDGASSGFSSDVNTTGISGGLGLDAYRILSLSDNQYLRFNIGASTNDLGQDIDDGNGYIVSVFDKTRLGTMISWKYMMNNMESININLAYQLATSFEAETAPNNHHIGLEGRYSLEEDNMYFALRVGAIWSNGAVGTEFQYTTLGGSVNLKGFYVDFGILPERLNGLNNVNFGAGYQKLLN
jgi:hypothetical protein